MKSLHLGQYVVAIRAMVVLTVITGIAYPLLVLGVAQAFSGQADGSLIHVNGQLVGSRLIGQDFSGKDQYFQSRPSAAGKNGYDPTASGASNYSLDNPDFLKALKAAQAAAAQSDGVAATSIPAEAIMASGSGLDPDISPAYAAEQVNRVASVRRLPVDLVKKLVAEHTSDRQLGFLGEPTVNVLELNLALDRTRS